MRFERIGRNAVKITVSGNEARGAGLSGKGQPASGREGAFMSLVERIAVSPAVGEVIGGFSGRISGEVIPGRDGGFVIYICAESTPAPALSRYIITVGDIDSLVNVCTELSMAGLSSPECALFADSRTARLTARLPREKCPLIERLREYALLSPADDHVMTAVREHYRPVIERNAVEAVLEKL